MAAVFLLALAVRGIHLVAVGKAPFARLLIGDARSYDRWAQEIAAGDWLGRQTFYQAPLYPYVLGALYAVAGRDPMTVRWVQALLGAAACAALAAAGRAWFSRREGLVAGVLLALYPPAVFFDGIVQKAALDNLFMCALLALLGAWLARDREDDRLLAAAGAVLALFALTRENALVFFVVLAAWIPWHRRGRPWRARVAPVALLAAGMAAVLLPVGLRNKVVGGEFLITTSQAGSNFYIGNGPQANGRYVPIRPGREMPEFERTDATEVAEQAVGHALTPGQVSAYWWARSFSWIRAHPGAWLRLMATKGLLVWNRVELPDTESFEVYRDASWILAALGRLLGFGVLAPIAIAGMVFAWSATPRPSLLYAMLLVFSAAVAAFYVFARYRFPMVPILVLFAAYALTRAGDAWRDAASVRLKPAAAAALLAAVAVNWPVVSAAGTRALSYANLGIGFADEQRFADAVPFYRTAIDLAPGEPDAHYNLAVALGRLDRPTEAASELVTVLRLDPGYAPAHDNLGVLLAQSGNFADAEKHFREALRLDPSSVLTRVNLGNVALEQGRAAEAVELYREALRLRPEYAEARMNLVQALSRAGRRDEAIAEAREVLRRDPASAEARRALDDLK